MDATQIASGTGVPTTSAPSTGSTPAAARPRHAVQRCGVWAWAGMTQVEYDRAGEVMYHCYDERVEEAAREMTSEARESATHSAELWLERGFNWLDRIFMQGHPCKATDSAGAA